MGAAGTVTGSSYILTSDSGSSILIDLGMFQGPSDLDKLNYEKYEYDVSTLSGAVLTHAHLDHCGRLPILLSGGYKGKIWMTPATRDLTQLSLLDSAKVAVQDNHPILYDKELAYKTIDRFKTEGYHIPMEVGDFKVIFHDAGHILGSVFLEIEDMRSQSEIKKIIFSGDLGNTPEDLVPPTEYVSSADAVVMESTYGDRLHPEEDALQMLQNEVNAVEKNGGTLLIPVFALERTQEVLHMLMHLKRTQKVKNSTPIILDSPMAEEATMIYLQYPQLLNTHIQEDIKEMGSPFGFEGLQIISSHAQSKGIEHTHGPKVILAGSGMMAGGRIVGHAAHYLSDSSSHLFIVGYQGEETLGRELMKGKKEVVIEGTAVPVRATVTTTHAMSSHADQQQLLNWLKQIKNVKKVFLTHGEDEPRMALRTRIANELGIDDITLPTLHQEITF